MKRKYGIRKLLGFCKEYGKEIQEKQTCGEVWIHKSTARTHELGNSFMRWNYPEYEAHYILHVIS